jgi:hypothetical protein
MPTNIIITMSITNGTLVAGGSRIIRIGSERIIRNGLETAIGMNTIIGMIAIGAKNTMLDGRMSIIAIGSSVQHRERDFSCSSKKLVAQDA